MPTLPLQSQILPPDLHAVGDTPTSPVTAATELTLTFGLALCFAAWIQSQDRLLLRVQVAAVGSARSAICSHLPCFCSDPLRPPPSPHLICLLH